MGRPPKAVMFDKSLHVGAKRYFAVTRKGQKIVAAADTRKELASQLRKKKGNSFVVLENPKVRGVHVQSIPPKSQRRRGAWSRYQIF